MVLVKLNLAEMELMELVPFEKLGPDGDVPAVPAVVDPADSAEAPRAWYPGRRPRHHVPPPDGHGMEQEVPLESMDHGELDEDAVVGRVVDDDVQPATPTGHGGDMEIGFAGDLEGKCGEGGTASRCGVYRSDAGPGTPVDSERGGFTGGIGLAGEIRRRQGFHVNEVRS